MKKNTAVAILPLVLSVAIAMDEQERAWSKTDEEIDRFYGSAAAERGSRSQREALASWEKGILAAKLDQPEQSIPYLGNALRKLSSTNIFQLAERVAVYDSAQEALLAIPGHAGYFGDRIRAAYEPLKGPEPGPYIHSAQQEMMYGFATLRHLPSPETVKVLGEMLSETWRMERPPTVEYTPPSSFSLPPYSGPSFGKLDPRNSSALQGQVERPRSLARRRCPQPYRPLGRRSRRSDLISHRGKNITFRVDLAHQKQNPLSDLTASGNGAATFWEWKGGGRVCHPPLARISAEQSVPSGRRFPPGHTPALAARLQPHHPFVSGESGLALEATGHFSVRNLATTTGLPRIGVKSGELEDEVLVKDGRMCASVRFKNLE